MIFFDLDGTLLDDEHAMTHGLDADPRIFAEACRRAAVDAGNAVYVGDDRQADVEGSVAAGLRAIWLRRSGEAGADPPSGVPTIASLTMLPHALDALRVHI